LEAYSSNKKGLTIMKTKLMVVFAILILHMLAVDSHAHNGHQESSVNSEQKQVTQKVRFQDNFSTGQLEAAKWHIIRQGDFRESTVDVYDVDGKDGVDYRLRLRADTIGTADNTVKFHGVRAAEKIDLSKETLISFSLDWNNQRNGSYLAAGVYLCPTITDGSPKNEKDWLKFEYVGVPPGRNARAVVAIKAGRGMKQPYTEGWPKKQRTGRHIANQQVTLILAGKRLTVIENGQEIYKSELRDLSFDTAYLYLQMKSHSNYPAREVYFDNIVVADVVR
jgi:hypothetical protein